MASTKSFDKIIEEIKGMSLIEVAELVKALEEEFGVSAAMPMAAPVAASAASEGAAAQEEKAEYRVTLKEYGTEKIKAIKALRQVTTLNLTEAKKAVEEAPSVIAEAAPKDEAKKMKEELEKVGAKVELS